MVYIIIYDRYSEGYELHDHWSSQKIMSVFTTLEGARNEVDRLLKELRETVSREYNCEFPELKPEDYFKETRGIQYDAFGYIMVESFTIIEKELKDV